MNTAVASTAPLADVVATPATFGQRLQALPRGNQIGLGLGLVLLVALLVYLSSGARSADYRPVFTGLSDKDGGAIAAQLAQQQVPYRIEPGGTILVPSAQVYDVRMKLAAAGLPKGGLVGFELLDKPSLGQTQFNERLNFQRALEGELTRTITALADVSDARVHLAMPQQTGFFREQQKPSASVMLHLRGGRMLDRAQIAGIVHLVSSSVPELQPKAVSVLDQTGKLLSGNDEQGAGLGLDAHQQQYKNQLESNLARRIEALLEPIVGPGNLRSTVTADLDFSQSEQTSEAYAPNQGASATQAVRSQQTNESINGNSALPSGVPGAVTNQPPVPAQAPINGASAPLQGTQQGAGNSSRRDSVINFELDKTVRVTRAATGEIRRLNAAVVLNHRTKTDAKGKTTTEPLPQEEVDRVTQLVRQAIGFNEQRGDSLQVVSSAFVKPEVVESNLPLWQQTWARDLFAMGAVPLALVLVALIIVFGMVRPAIKAAFPPAVIVDEKVPQGATLSEVVGDTPALPAPQALGLPALEAPIDATKLERARMFAQGNPLAVANVVRAWMQGEEPSLG
ncbi:MAG: flagellar basal-body MS-ring/collar protein FliF [Burkholderiales bacterium]|jgi:flagellar M-ring protein FliF